MRLPTRRPLAALGHLDIEITWQQKSNWTGAEPTACGERWPSSLRLRGEDAPCCPLVDSRMQLTSPSSRMISQMKKRRFLQDREVVIQTRRPITAWSRGSPRRTARSRSDPTRPRPGAAPQRRVQIMSYVRPDLIQVLHLRLVAARATPPLEWKVGFLNLVRQRAAMPSKSRAH